LELENRKLEHKNSENEFDKEVLHHECAGPHVFFSHSARIMKLGY